MTANKSDMKAAWIDPDDAPELTDEWFDSATMHDAGMVRRLPGQRGPGKKTPKESVTLRLDPEILAYFRETGEGWQTRINDELKSVVLKRKRL